MGKKLDWKRGRMPAEGWYVLKGPTQEDEEAGVSYRTVLKTDLLWIGPLDISVKAEEPPAPDWGRGPVPADGRYYLFMGDDFDSPDPEAGSFTAGYSPVCQSWYGPIPDPPKVEETEPNEWADLAGEKRCSSHGVHASDRVRCCLADGHLNAHRSTRGYIWGP